MKELISMDLQLYAQIAEIIAAFSIFLTLVFLVIELRKNMSQTKSLNIANRDLVNSEFVHFWADEKNARLVVKGRSDFASLDSVELYQFESFIDQRVKLFAFGSTTVFGEDRKIQQHKIQNQSLERNYQPPKWLLGNETWYSPIKKEKKNG